MTITTKELQFKGFGVNSSCRYHMFRESGKLFCVVEQTCKTTTSITNRIEEIIPEIKDKEKLMNVDSCFYEWYPIETFGVGLMYEMRRVQFTEDLEPIWMKVKDENFNRIRRKLVPVIQQFQ